MASKANQARWSRFPDVGCIACRRDGRRNDQTQVHHLNVGGRAGQKRRGDDFTIPLCAWHHQGQAPVSSMLARSLYGPSLAHESKAFRQRYGTDGELLALTNELIERRHEL